ncbi:ribonuclease H [Candidatus Uhrbacteria bacterium CG_4_9_14_3_um_filter_36_7]|uniref:Ribonuclease H n=1 Tax=Candidatus Uhrbacteria bacterium CG_4_9_14_3_um_filter_36_7 TaxID=1975033 RepID=A0A2M7XI89_9BACT|nr:MAG: ribonuclease H [Candidatus Uhrbacteria bacterium CG_4_9_14_3_um_filter_36_7]
MMYLSIYTDGGARGNPGPSGAGAILKKQYPDGSEGEIFESLSVYLGEGTNNQAEYQALILALKKAKDLEATHLNIYMDSELIVKQLRNEYKVKHPELAKRFLEVHTLLTYFTSVHFTHIPREQNKEADKLVNEAIDQGIGKR